MDLRASLLVADDVTSAIRTQMLVLGQGQRVGNT